MKLLIVAVGQRVPDWAQTAYDDYAKRFPPELKVELKAVKTEPRASKTLETLYAAERERIGVRFHRLDRATPGHGLGLASVRAVIALHGGQLAFEDAAPGLRARIDLPGED